MRFTARIRNTFSFRTLILGLVLGLLWNLFLKTSSPAAALEYDPTEDLLPAFGNRCEGVAGDLYQSAFNQGQSLRQIAQSLQDDPNCQGVSELLNQVSSEFGPNWESLAASSQNQSERGQIDRQITEVQTEIQRLQSADPSSPLIKVYQEKVGELVLQKAAISPFVPITQEQKTHQRIQRGTEYAIQLIRQLRINTECRNKYPNLVAQIGGQILSLSSEIVGGVVGSVLYGVGAVINELVELFRDRSFARALDGVIQERQAHAIQCAVHAAASVYCEARDAQNLIQYSSRAIGGNQSLRPEEASLARGLNLITRQLPSFNRWVLQLYSVSPPSGVAQGEEKKGALRARVQAETLDVDFQALIARTSAEIGNLPDEQSRDTARITLVNALSDVVTEAYTLPGTRAGIGTTRPSFQADLECGPRLFFYSKGKTRTCIPLSGPKVCDACYLRAAGVGDPLVLKAPSLEEIQWIASEITKESNRYAANQLSLFRESNPLLFVANFRRQSDLRSAPSDLVENAIQYLDSDLPTEGDFKEGGPLRQLADLIRDKLRRTLEFELKYSDPSKKDGLSSYRSTLELQNAFTTLSADIAPQNDANYISNALNEIVRRHLDFLIQRRKISPELVAVINDSVGNPTALFTRNNLRLDSLKRQAVQAARLSLQNLKALSQLFSQQLETRIQNLGKERAILLATSLNPVLRNGSQSSPLSQRSGNAHPLDHSLKENDQELALSCIYWMISQPLSEQKLNPEVLPLCYNRTFSSVYQAPHLRIRTNDLFFKRIGADPKSVNALQETVCAPYDFFRNSRLYEIAAQTTK